jgi:aminopeptidase N
LPWQASAAPSVAPAAVDYAAAMRSGLAADANRADLPQYDLDLTIDPAARRLSGAMQLSFRNTTGGELRDVVLRLYPQFPADVFGDGGDITMDVSNIVVQGAATKASYEARRTVLRLPLPAPVANDQTITLSLDYTANIVAWQRSDGTFPLPSYYPMLAAWQDGWRTDLTRFPDRVYASSALYHARITVPTGWTAVTTGSTIGTSERDQQTTFEAVSGPVREFALTVGRFAVARATHNGVSIAVYHRTGDGLDRDAATMANHIAASVATFDDRFGLYPYRELEFHLINAKRGYDIGVEYPGLVIILLNGRYTEDTRFVTAHETAHQWFYGVIGNDIYNEPWLDESFAQYSGMLVEEQWAGPAAARRTYDRHIARLAARTQLPAGLSITDYGAWNAYYAAVYGRGAQFLYTLRGEIGDRAFFDGLRSYYAAHKYGVAHAADVRAAFERSSGRDLGPLFKRWIGR